MKFRLIGTGAGKVCKVTGDRNSQKCLGQIWKKLKQFYLFTIKIKKIISSTTNIRYSKLHTTVQSLQKVARISPCLFVWVSAPMLIA